MEGYSERLPDIGLIRERICQGASYAPTPLPRFTPFNQKIPRTRRPAPYPLTSAKPRYRIQYETVERGSPGRLAG